MPTRLTERQRRTPIAVALATVALLVACAACLAASAANRSAPAGPDRLRVLVFSHTEGFRHDSIAAGTAAIERLGKRHGFAVRATEDAAALRAKPLRRYAAVVFLNTTGDALDASAQRALRRFVARGGGFVGIHSAADTEYGWPFYGRLVGARFQSHPAVQTATVRVVDDRHPSTRSLPAKWIRTDEWYDFAANPRGSVHVLATVDESTYDGATMGADHPIAWCQRIAGGRSWYTGGGHTIESYAEPLFRRHLLGGIRWAAGAASGDCST